MGGRARFRFIVAPSALAGMPPGWQRARVIVSHANAKWYAATGPLPVRGGAVAVPELAFACHVEPGGDKARARGARGAGRGRRAPGGAAPRARVWTGGPQAAPAPAPAQPPPFPRAPRPRRAQHVHLTLLGSARRRGGLVLGGFEHVAQCRLAVGHLAALVPQQHAAVARRVTLAWSPPAAPGGGGDEDGSDAGSGAADGGGGGGADQRGGGAAPAGRGLRQVVEVTAVRLSRSGAAAAAAAAAGAGEPGVAACGEAAGEAALAEVADGAREGQAAARDGAGGREGAASAGRDGSGAWQLDG
jgi:hypothetical protein